MHVKTIRLCCTNYVPTRVRPPPSLNSPCLLASKLITFSNNHTSLLSRERQRVRLSERGKRAVGPAAAPIRTMNENPHELSQLNKNKMLGSALYVGNCFKFRRKKENTRNRMKR